MAVADGGKSKSDGAKGKPLGLGGWVLIAALFAYAVHLADNANQSFSNDPKPAAKKPAPAVTNNSPARAQPTAKKTRTSGCPSDLRYGDRGEEVRQLQAALNAEDLAAPIAVDGRFEVGTEGLVRAFQKKAFGSHDGIVGAATWKKLGQCR